MRALTSGVPRGSGLGQLVFVKCINDMDDNVGLISEFADDTEIGWVPESKEDMARHRSARKFGGGIWILIQPNMRQCTLRSQILVGYRHGLWVH